MKLKRYAAAALILVFLMVGALPAQAAARRYYISCGDTGDHSDPYCSNIVEPRQMPCTCAEECGFLPCARCFY